MINLFQIYLYLMFYDYNYFYYVYRHIWHIAVSIYRPNKIKLKNNRNLKSFLMIFS